MLRDYVLLKTLREKGMTKGLKPRPASKVQMLYLKMKGIIPTRATSTKVVKLKDVLKKYPDYKHPIAPLYVPLKPTPGTVARFLNLFSSIREIESCPVRALFKALNLYDGGKKECLYYHVVKYSNVIKPPYANKPFMDATDLGLKEGISGVAFNDILRQRGLLLEDGTPSADLQKNVDYIRVPYKLLNEEFHYYIQWNVSIVEKL